jgi:hypothetical protein
MNNLPPELPGQDYASSDFNAMRRSNRSLQPMTAPGTLVTHSPGHGVMIRAARQRPRQGVTDAGIDFAKPRNYDHTKSYKAKRLVYVKPDDSMVMDGTTDPDSMTTVKAIAGWWLSLRSVAPKVIDAVTYYYIPHLPMPTPGDMDADNNYWTFIAPDAQCYT